MPITSHIDPVRNLTEFTVKGALEFGEVKAAVETFYAGETTRHVLWDFLATTENRITPEQAEALLAMKQRYAGGKGTGKTAVVAQDSFFHGMSRSLALQNNLSEARYTAMVFNSRRAAYKWFEASAE